MDAPPPVPTLKQKPVQELNPDDVVKVDTTEVMFPVTVRDGNGNLVNNLTRNDFRVYEDNTQQPLSDLALRQVPVDVILMVDASSSVANNIDDFSSSSTIASSSCRTGPRAASNCNERSIALNPGCTRASTTHCYSLRANSLAHRR
jgi:hypothetical protein